MNKIKNGDVKSAVVSDILAKNFAYGKFRRDMKKAADVGLERVDTLFMFGGSFVGSAFVFGITFKSPVHDGWLNEHKPVADLFFRAYSWGGKHWPDEVEDIYPHLSLYIRNEAELQKYEEWVTSFTIIVPALDGMAGTSPQEAENTTVAADAYVQIVPVYMDVEVTVWDEASMGYVTKTVQKLTKTEYTYYAISLDRLFEIPNKLFYEFVTDGRISSTVDFAKASWLESWLPVITIALGVVLIASVGFDGGFLSGQSFLNSGFAFLGDTFTPMVLETFGSYGVAFAGAASSAYELYSGFSYLHDGLSAMGGSPSSAYMPPEKLDERMKAIYGMQEVEFFPWENTFSKFEQNLNIGGL